MSGTQSPEILRLVIVAGTAIAIILFVAVFGLANIYVKALNKVKQR